MKISMDHYNKTKSTLKDQIKEVNNKICTSGDPLQDSATSEEVKSRLQAITARDKLQVLELKQKSYRKICRLKNPTPHTRSDSAGFPSRVSPSVFPSRPPLPAPPAPPPSPPFRLLHLSMANLFRTYLYLNLNLIIDPPSTLHTIHHLINLLTTHHTILLLLLLLHHHLRHHHLFLIINLHPFLK